MIKKLICILFGHKIVHKAFTGDIISTIGPLGNQQDAKLYVWKRSKFCIRCGKTVDPDKRDK